MEQFSYLIHGSMLFVAGLVIGLGGALFSLRRRKVDHDELERLRGAGRTLAADLPDRANTPELMHEEIRRAVPTTAPAKPVTPIESPEQLNTLKAVSSRRASTHRAEPVLSASRSVSVETLRADTLLAAGESATGDASNLTRNLRRALLSGGQDIDGDEGMVTEEVPNKNASKFQS